MLTKGLGLDEIMGLVYHKISHPSNTIGYIQVRLVPIENARLLWQTPNGDGVGQMVGSTSS